MTDQTNNAAMDLDALEQIANESENTERQEENNNEVEAISDYEKFEPDPKIKEMLHGAIYGGFQVLAPNWEITIEESEGMADLYARLLEKHFPDMKKSFSLEYMALAHTGAILITRLGKPRKIEHVKDSETDEPETETTRPGDNKKPTPQALQGFADLPEG